MPTKYSPGVQRDDGTQYFTEGAAAGLANYFGMARQRRLDREQAERDALDDAAKRGDLYEQGLREGTAPQQTISSELDVQLPEGDAFAGQGMGMQPQGGPTRSPLAGNVERAGMARLGSFQTPAQQMPTQQPPEVLALPGAFVPEIGGFTSTPIFNAPAMPQMAPPSMDVADPSKVQLNEQFYLDTEQTPGARERAAAGAERSRVSGALSNFRGMSPERAQQAMELLEAGVPASVVFQQIEDPEATLEELIAAGVPPEVAPLALRDPALARQWLQPPDDPDDPAAAFNPETDVPLQRALEMERRRRSGELPRAGSGTSSSTRPADAPTFDQAYDIVQGEYAKRATESPLSPVVGYQLEQAEMVERARRLARGESPDSVLLPVPRDSVTAAVVDETNTDQPGLLQRGAAAIANFFRGARERAARRTQQEGMPPAATGSESAERDTATAAPAAGAPRPDSLAQAREALQGLPPTVQRSLLRQQGYTPEEIERIVGGGGG